MKRAVSYAKGKSSRTSMENSSKYIPPPMCNKGKKPTNIEGKKEEKCWKCGDKYFVGHKCAFYTRNIIDSNSKKTEKDDAENNDGETSVGEGKDVQELREMLMMGIDQEQGCAASSSGFVNDDDCIQKLHDDRNHGHTRVAFEKKDFEIYVWEEEATTHFKKGYEAVDPTQFPNGSSFT